MTLTFPRDGLAKLVGQFYRELGILLKPAAVAIDREGRLFQDLDFDRVRWLDRLWPDPPLIVMIVKRHEAHSLSRATQGAVAAEPRSSAARPSYGCP